MILATGIVPRTPSIPGIEHAKVASYTEIVDGRKNAGQRVALIGAGGIGFDVAELLTAADPPDAHAGDGRADDPAVAAFTAEWGIDRAYRQRGGLMAPHDPPRARKLWLLQRKSEKVGAGLAKTTGWIRRTLLKKRGVSMTGGVEYEGIDDANRHETGARKEVTIPPLLLRRHR